MKKTGKKYRKSSALSCKKPETVAALAGGMADDFNNILTTVMGACSLIKMDDPDNDELLQCVALIRASAEHAASLSEQLAHASTHERSGNHPREQIPGDSAKQNGTGTADKNVHN